MIKSTARPSKMFCLKEKNRILICKKGSEPSYRTVTVKYQ